MTSSLVAVALPVNELGCELQKRTFFDTVLRFHGLRCCSRNRSKCVYCLILVRKSTTSIDVLDMFRDDRNYACDTRVWTFVAH